jgi:hypothetical protein
LKGNFEMKSCQLCSYFTQTISAKYLSAISKAPAGDAKQTWELLTAHFESKTRLSVQQTAARLVNLRQDSKSVIEHLSTVLTTRDLLLAALSETEDSSSDSSPLEKRLLDAFTINAMTDGLHDRYITTKQHLLMRDDLDIDSCYQAVLEHCRILDNGFSSNTSASSSTALAVSSQVCSECGRSGHSKDKCYRLHPELNPRHRGGGARAKQAQGIYPEFLASNQAWRVKVLKAEAVYRPPSTPLSSSVIRFEIDSGASAHFVYSPIGLDHFDSHQTMTVQVVDQHSLSTTGVGEIQGKIKAVHVVPEFGTNLLSVLSLALLLCSIRTTVSSLVQPKLCELPVMRS